MVLSNFYKTCSGLGKVTGAIPIPINGTTNSNNAWTKAQTGDPTNQCQSSTLNITAEGNNHYTYAHNMFYKYKVNSGTGWGFFVDVGFGDTTETREDYKLANSNAEMSSPMLTHVSGANKAFSMPSDDPTSILCVESTYQNNTSTSVTVKEVGLVYCVGAINNQTPAPDWTGANFLMARQTLSNPVSIASGKKYKFTYKVKVYLP